ncbi:MAG: type II toxin-antitoxin system VapB family antitoxin [Gammaproteobacteria bacterium]|nr:type II toxin-antitoxin system VapB family antitoxin [Gammaproteobacteria bacterium]
MNTQVTIDSILLQQAMQVTHAASTRELIENALRQMIQRHPVKKITADLPRVKFGKTASLEELIQQQGINPVTDIRDLAGDFWPENESIDDFVKFIRQQRREDAEQSA